MMKNKILILILIISAITLIGIIVGAKTTELEYNKYVKEYDNNIYNIIGIIKEKYPNISEQEIAILLNGTQNKNHIENGKEVLKKYGIEEKSIQNLEKIYRENVAINCITIFIVVSLIIITILIYKIYEKKQINEITKYIREINDKNYTLKIDENTEDDLTNLRNELYKITLMLREEADNSKKDKLKLKESLSDISHQIKTPLTSISIMLDEIKENTEMEDRIKQKFIFEISRQIEQISFLIISLLKMSKLDADAVQFEEKEISLKKLIDDVLRNLEVPIELKEQHIVKEIENSKIIGDYRWTLEAITNIVKNCIEHTEKGKKIYIKSKNTNIYVELIIKDEGEGISEKDLKHIFERFYKGKNSSENSFGIGLSLAKSIIEKQNASIYCTSKENEGTTFRIRWRNSKKE